jgi:hypothetical protein
MESGLLSWLPMRLDALRKAVAHDRELFGHINYYLPLISCSSTSSQACNKLGDRREILENVPCGSCHKLRRDNMSVQTLIRKSNYENNQMISCQFKTRRTGTIDKKLFRYLNQRARKLTRQWICKPPSGTAHRKEQEWEFSYPTKNRPPEVTLGRGTSK